MDNTFTPQKTELYKRLSLELAREHCELMVSEVEDYIKKCNIFGARLSTESLSRYLEAICIADSIDFEGKSIDDMHIDDISIEGLVNEILKERLHKFYTYVLTVPPRGGRGARGFVYFG